MAAWQEIIGLAKISEFGIQNLGGTARNCSACPDLWIWNPESWRHSKVCRSLAEILKSWPHDRKLLCLPRPPNLVFIIMAAWQSLHKACQDSSILAAWQEIIGFAKILQAGIQNRGGTARNCRACQDHRIWYPESWQHIKIYKRLAKILKPWLQGRKLVHLPRSQKLALTRNYWACQGLKNLGGMARNYWAYQELRIWYTEFWRHGRKLLGLQKPRNLQLESRIMAAWHDLQKSCQDSKILAAWQEMIGLARTSECGIQNPGGMARNYWACQDLRIWNPGSWRHSKVCRRVAKILKSWRHGRMFLGLPRP